MNFLATIGVDTMKKRTSKKQTEIQLSAKNKQTNKSGVVFVSGLCGRWTPVVHPDDVRLMPWTLIGAFFIVYEVLLMPYRFCFSAPPEGFFWYFENLLTTYFIVDVAFNFFIGYTTPRGDFVTNHSAVRWNYLKGWFLVDFVAPPT